MALFISSDLLAQKDTVPLSLEILSNLKVKTASKFEEKIADAPGIITVITSDEIEKYGANSLVEVLERVTSSYPTGSHFFPQNVVSFRGDLLSHYTNHVLLLLNDRPLGDSYSGGIVMPILTSLPLATIERIEIIRGPGSALYGTNAYSGVINIITKKPEKENFTSETMGGSYSTIGFGLNGMTSAKKWHFHVAATSFSEDGWELQAIDPKQTDSSMKYGESNHSGFFDAHYKNFKFTSFIAHSQQDFLGAVFNWSSSPDLILRKMNSTRAFAGISQKIELDEKVSLDAHLTYNHMDFDHYNYTSFSDDVIGELVSNFKFNDNLGMLIGGLASLQTFGSEEGLRDAPIAYNQNSFYSTYGLLTYKPTKFLNITAGGQLNIPRARKSTFVPRVAVVGHVSNQIGFKALYGEGYRSPFAVETDFNIIIKNDTGAIVGGLRGNPDLLSEKMKSFNFEVFCHHRLFHLSAIYFDNQQQNLITRERAGDNVIDFINKGKLFGHGVEFETKVLISTRLIANVNYSYQKNRNDDGVNDFTPVPNHMVKGGISYDFKNGISLAIFNSYFGVAPDIINTSPDREAFNPPSGAYNLLSANISFSVPKVFKFKTYVHDIKFNLYGYNILNQNIHHPEFIGKAVNTIPGRSPIGIYGKLQLIL